MAAHRFESALAAFEIEDRLHPPRPGAILFAGSSSITRWNRQLPDDMAPLDVVGRGFGGSTMADLLDAADRILLPWAPRALVVYEGDNDLASGRPVDGVWSDFERFLAWATERLPAARLYFLAVKYSPARRAIWPLMRRLNQRLWELEKQQPGRWFVLDTATPLMTREGEPRAECYAEDGLHLSPAGVAVWRSVIRPALLAREGHASVKT